MDTETKSMTTFIRIETLNGVDDILIASQNDVKFNHPENRIWIKVKNGGTIHYCLYNVVKWEIIEN